eukprot:5264789-Prymnesium_polylepis.1
MGKPGWGDHGFLGAAVDVRGQGLKPYRSTAIANCREPAASRGLSWPLSVSRTLAASRSRGLSRPLAASRAASRGLSRTFLMERDPPSRVD